MKLNQQQYHLGIFDSELDFIRHYIFKDDQNRIKYSYYINCEKFLKEWKIFRYEFQRLRDGKIVVYEQ